MTDRLSELAEDLKAWLFDAALPMWWDIGADHLRGGFHELIGQDGRPIDAPRRARVQTRQVYSYAAAGRLGWTGPWREAVAHGLGFFVGNYRRADGLFRTKVNADGSPNDDTVWIYDQAFALFSLAQAFASLPGRDDLKATARTLVAALDTRRLPAGGYREADPKHPIQSNPHMHLLEACLAWAEQDDAPVWNALADEIVGLALAKFIDAGGALHEFFTEDWRFEPGVDGRIVEPGHQFEWAWLLARWARLRGRDDAHRAALRLFEVGKSGVDRRGVATQQLLDDGSVHDDVARLWPQTERIKAALILGDREEAARGIEGLNLYLNTPIRGLWWDKLKPDGAFIDEPAPASSFYHIICAIAELAGTPPRAD